LKNELTDWDIVKHFAFASFAMCFAVDFTGIDIVEKVLFVSVTAKTLGCWPNILAVCSISIPPCDV
jgi:hypothetical protein